MEDVYVYKLVWKLHIPDDRAADEAVSHRTHVWIPLLFDNLRFHQLDVQVLINRDENSRNRYVILKLNSYLLSDQCLEI